MRFVYYQVFNVYFSREIKVYIEIKFKKSFIQYFWWRTNKWANNGHSVQIILEQGLLNVTTSIRWKSFYSHDS